MMKIGCAWLYAITKYGYPPSIEDTFNAIRDMAKLGFKYIEIEGLAYDNLKEVIERRKEIKELADSLGLKFMNFCPIIHDIVSVDPSKSEKALKYFEKACELAVYLGSDMIQLDSFTPPLEFVGEVPYKEAISFGLQIRVRIPPEFSWKKFWDNLVNNFRKAAKIAADHGLKLLMEPRVGETVSNTDAMLRLIDAVGMDNFGAVLDTGHLHAQKEILPLSALKLGDKLFYVHVSDNDGRDNYHLGLGKGTIDWEGLFLVLKRIGFNGFIAIDVGGSGFKGDIDAEVLQSKRFLEDLMRRLDIPVE
ncbi:MAG: hypothetical protein DRJ66_01335 [Thermoprotei archaeon]|nr:MAG: hypothetical protein DRJ66_01335 [Thermoprotei archaeon]